MKAIPPSLDFLGEFVPETLLVTQDLCASVTVISPAHSAMKTCSL